MRAYLLFDAAISGLTSFVFGVEPLFSVSTCITVDLISSFWFRSINFFEIALTSCLFSFAFDFGWMSYVCWFETFYKSSINWETTLCLFGYLESILKPQMSCCSCPISIEFRYCIGISFNKLWSIPYFAFAIANETKSALMWRNFSITFFWIMFTSNNLLSK